MEVIRGGKRDCGQEVCGEVERRGARAARGDDFHGQALGTVADEGAHPAEGGCVGGRGGLEPTARSLRRWTPASTISAASAVASSRKGSMGRRSADTIRPPPG